MYISSEGGTLLMALIAVKEEDEEGIIRLRGRGKHHGEDERTRSDMMMVMMMMVPSFPSSDRQAGSLPLVL